MSGASDKKAILYVEDNINFRAQVTQRLQREGHAVLEASNVVDARKLFHDNTIDLIITDIELNCHIDGLDLVEELLKHRPVPFMVISAYWETRFYKRALDLGAQYFHEKKDADHNPDRLQDILATRDENTIAEKFYRASVALETKPIELQSLVLWVNRVLHARPDLSAPHSGAAPQPGLVLDGDCLTCTWNGQPVHLTATQFRLVQALARFPGRVLNRGQLVEAAGLPVDSGSRDDRIKDHIKRIRAEFHRVDPEFASIETVYSGGYRFVASDPAPSASAA